MNDDKETLPLIIHERIDNKGLTTTVFYDFLYSDAAKSKLSKETEVILYTTIGIVKGRLLYFNDDEEDGFVKFHKGLMNKKHEYIKDQENEQEKLKLINDASSLPLTDVTITPYGLSNSQSLSYFLLFADQIVGISIGESKKDDE